MTSHDFASKRCHIYGFFQNRCKGTTKNAHTQEKREKYAKKQ